MMAVEFFLYSKANCSACDVFKARLEQDSIVYYLIDITADPELQQRYGARIPVLVADGTEVCEGVYNAQVVTRYVHNRNQPIE